MCCSPLKSDIAIKILIGNINIFNLLNLKLDIYTKICFTFFYNVNS